MDLKTAAKNYDLDFLQELQHGVYVGKKMKVLGPFDDLQIVETGEWVCNLILPGDIIILHEVYSHCQYPGCCPKYVKFIALDMPELGYLEGQMWRPEEKLKLVKGEEYGQTNSS